MSSKKHNKLTYKIDLTVEQDDTPVRGNALASGNDEDDRECENAILRRLNRGDEWAWCVVTVTASVEFEGETFKGRDTLGACSYRDEADFRQPGGYLDDMKASALDDLRRTINETAQGKRQRAATALLSKILVAEDGA